MEILIFAVVAVFMVSRGATDIAATVTGKTPPSHAYRMAKLQAKGEQRRTEPDPDTRAGLGRVARHWYLDACEDADAWRAERHLSKPERKARKAARKAKRQAVIDAAKTKAKQRMAAARGDKGTGRPAGPLVMPEPPPVPELPDNVIPFARKPQPGPAPAEPSGPTANNGPAAPAAAGTDTDTKENRPMDTANDAAGLSPHVAALNNASGYLVQLNTMLERIQAQMTQADMGAEVTGALGTARDANTNASEAMKRAAEVTEQVNRKVQEAYNASQGQAANKDYQQQGQ
ncbi:hypothetical protein CLV63_113198 [Murinocardiopsis flavida]|uniref:Uncharacterized protein n=1 Tax=Murinocardiopsis flavida TaxID=645275 RepID=A0A2P8DFP5_9ACTN|nr:hypothetical protein [Murinocardiopsis flavida]PSK96035.1 hypothetical protein CLV63_113198 [Murinocardiopsis flavida]